MTRKAQEDFEKGLSLTPNDEQSWIARGTARITHDPAGALADFEGALTINPHSHGAMQNATYVLIEITDEKEKALEMLTRMLRLDPHDEVALAARGVLLAHMGNREDALKDIETLLTHTNDTKPVYQAATAFALTSAQESADIQRAIALLSRAFQSDPSLVEIAQTDPDLEPIRDTDQFKEVYTAAETLHRNSEPKP